MTKPKKKGQRLATAYWSLVGAGTAVMVSLQPVLATTIWTRFSTIMKDFYGQLVTISTRAAAMARSCRLRPAGADGFPESAVGR